MADQTNDPRADRPARGPGLSADPSGAAGSHASSAAGTDASGPSTSSSSRAAQDARESAGHVGDQASQSAKETADVAKQHASQVAATATEQVRDLADHSRAELTDQARTQQGRLAESLRDLGQQFGQMADNADEGMAGQLVGEAGDRLHTLGSWLQSREPNDVLDEVRRYAGRKPGSFLLIAAGVGFLGGRLTRSLSGDSGDSGNSGDGSGARHRSPDSAPGSTDAPRQTTGPQSSVAAGLVGTTTGVVDDTGAQVDPTTSSAGTIPNTPTAESTGSEWQEGPR